ncbi:hypothetical protein [Flagellimonas halotolerans]|uniref:Uncharacterized protein n=1 Tax=Flagellimonas halotolerans TaxID=3112164 RepID=A0ABU6ISJ9_9FLAO|nr:MULTISPECIES: hypothetical protein [unclassified Allomuricauda]MEC3966219.1 hypothetical protein [Muricauda sp. SYSU M86414]MEC4266095.1 hypothetical protein [Muricauda sp. SYSU M84420]
MFDLSGVDLHGGHTTAIRGAGSVEYPVGEKRILFFALLNGFSGTFFL